ncbi:hypothetical protein P153DRAFT_420745 [Dothidotthia symphoricarpi CBS 119687]|uniref:CorA-like transporter domain-containing protein n=1 Tax=Dothidotthia symphoricarpi CBS 119687 TaxID=1392245 RepID=A0A6A6AP57_9PLEO|nr:uncharacterized protein P153DRAFT_420745 [Dothidotthia symphoricarpi CBS 119687]KAF2132835.1 hypothetical protein P153DRAFT_420745 [Dothidotthia symphoricarpi CBS 119687]
MSVQNSQPRTWPWTFPKCKVLLDDDSDAANIQIADIAPGQFASATFTSSTKAREALRCKPGDEFSIRIISIFSAKTISPLQVTSELLEYIFDTYNVHHDFANVVASFGQDPNKAEGSSNNAAVHIKSSGECELSYQIRYVEENQRSKLDPWSLRHSGIYHCHGSTGEADTFILLHPVLEPAIRRKIDALQHDALMREALSTNPFLFHTWGFSQYFDNWRWYCRHLDHRFAEDNDLAMVMRLERAEPNTSFRCVKSLRNTNDLIIFARACCSGNLDLVNRLQTTPIRLLSEIDELSTHVSKMKGYVESADVLEGRVQNLIDLVGYTLTLRNQMEAAKVQLEAAKIDTELRDLTEGLKKLGEQSVDDSATVKIITFVSAVYLPGSFAATLYGMNFFLFDATSKRLQISSDFWIFVLTWIPLTLITGGTYMLFLYLHARRQGREFRWPWQRNPKNASTIATTKKAT